MRSFVILLLTCISYCSALSAQEPPVQVQLFSDRKSIAPHESFWVALQFKIAPDFHLYWKNPGTTSTPPTVAWQLPPGITVGKTLWSKPILIEGNRESVFGYSGECAILFEMRAGDVKVSETLTLTGDVSWIAFGPRYVPGSQNVSLQLPVVNQGAVQEVNAGEFTRFRQMLPETGVYQIVPQPGGSDLVVESKLESFQTINKIYFFPNQPGLIDPSYNFTWDLDSSKRRVTVHLPLTPQQVDGVLYISFQFANKQDEYSFAITPQHIQETSTESEEWYDELPSTVRDRFNTEFHYILFLAFIGGMLLNLMPCVLPVLSLKVFHFMHLHGQSWFSIVKQGLAYSFGIIASFWALAGTIYILQMAGDAVGWGFQLQEPLFVATMILVLYILALSLFGVFEFGTKIAAFASHYDEEVKKGAIGEHVTPSLISSFSSGVLAAFIASPCTGPFLGSAIGFSATLNPGYSFIFFSVLGAGMALPFFLLSLFPALLKLLPKPGHWMVTFKQLMGFFLVATLLWLVWVLEAQVSTISIMTWFSSMSAVAFGLWVFGVWGSYVHNIVVRRLAQVIAIVFVVGGSYQFLMEVQRTRETKGAEVPVVQEGVIGAEWVPYSETALQEFRQKGIPVFLEFTAKWCLTCQTNKLVLESSSVKEAFIKYGVVKMRADWTQVDPEITIKLRSLGRNAVPVYAVYDADPNKPPVLLPELITPDIVIEAVKNVSHKQ